MVTLDGESLTIEDVRSVAVDCAKVSLANTARARMLRTREVVADFFAGSNQYGSTDASLQKYFDAYAIAARRRSP